MVLFSVCFPVAVFSFFFCVNFTVHTVSKKNMVSCCAKNCPNRDKDGKRFFRLPLGKNDRRRLKAWLEIAGRVDEGKLPSSNLRLCEDHFTSDQFESSRADGRKLLKPFAIPTVRVQHAVHEDGVDFAAASGSTVNLLQQSSSLMHSDVPGKDAVAMQHSAAFTEDAALLISDKCHADALREHRFSLVHDSPLVSGDVFISSEAGSFLLPATECGLSSPDARANRRSDGTVQAALKIRLACGSRAYQFLQTEFRELPLPSKHTLLRRIEGVKFKPETAAWYEAEHGFPGVIGCVNGCHIPIKEPREDRGVLQPKEVYVHNLARHV